MSDFSKLTPAPWIFEHVDNYKAENAYCVVFDKEDKILFDTINSEVSEIHSEYSMEGNDIHWDAQGEINLRFCALARNAHDVMMRRKWGVRVTMEGWNISNHLGLCHIHPKFVEWVEEQTWNCPFTALVEADKWFTENVEGKQ